VNAVFFGALMRTTEPVITASANAYRPTANTEEGIRILISNQERDVSYPPILAAVPGGNVRAHATPNRRSGVSGLETFYYVLDGKSGTAVRALPTIRHG
jgi:hypothetical protein